MIKNYAAQENDKLPKEKETAKLFEWADSIGIWINPKLHYPTKFEPGCTGVSATEKINPWEPLVLVPYQGLLTCELTDSSLESVFEENPDLFGSQHSESQDYKIIAYMLKELAKGSESFWDPYFKSLPSNPENLLDWSEKELLSLQDSDLVCDISIRQAKDYACNKALSVVLSKYPHHFEASQVSLKVINWCWRIVTTRAFGECVPHAALIPVADLLNHSNANTNYYYGNEEPPDLEYENKQSGDEDEDDSLYEDPPTIILSAQKLFRINTSVYSQLSPEEEAKLSQIQTEAKYIDALKLSEKLRSIVEKKKKSQVTVDKNQMFRVVTGKFEEFERDSQVCISYGRYSNRSLLTNYGFALPNNKYDYARFKLSLKDLLSGCQLEKLNYRRDMQVAFKVKASSVCMSLLRVLRCLEWSIDTNQAKDFFSPSNLLLEIKVLNRAVEVIQSQLCEFETTLEEDLDLLSQALSSRNYFALVYRIGVKQSLKSQLELLEVSTAVLEKLVAGEPFSKSIQIEELLGLYSQPHQFYKSGIEEYLACLRMYHQD